MSDYVRLINMLQASKAQLQPNPSNPPSCGLSPPNPGFELHEKGFLESSASSPAAQASLVEPRQVLVEEPPLPPKLSEPENEHPKVTLYYVGSSRNGVYLSENGFPSPSYQGQGFASDIVNDLAVANCKRIFDSAKDPLQLAFIAEEFNMAGRFPVLSTSNLPPASESEQSATASPARGTAMLNSIFTKVRVPEFRHKWQFWGEKGQQQSSKSSTDPDDFASRPKPLGELIISVKEFYQHFNNIPTDSLKLRDSIHLFHMGIKPLWEDPRNTRGGAYYFRIGKENAAQFWHEICLLAVGDVLQGAVETKRECKLACFLRKYAALTKISFQRRHLRHLLQRPLERRADRRVEP
jgi:hypothetical protein